MTKDLMQHKTQSPAPFAQGNALGNVESNRAIAEVQGQVLMAKQFPRDQIYSRRSIVEACKRMRLAETAIYSYPRGGTQIEGPSIRLAEMIAQNWGNIDYGVIEIEQRNKESVMMAYAWDMQTNTRQKIIFNVPHSRYTRKKGNTPLTDPRDIYEMVANMGARRLRKCILGIIPGDIIEEALEICNKTLAGNSNEPLIDRVKKMVAAFEALGVSQDIIEKRLGHKMEATLAIEVVQLGKIYKSIKDGMSEPKDWFENEKKQSSTEKTKAPDFNYKPLKKELDKVGPADVKEAELPKSQTGPAKVAKEKKPGTPPPTGIKKPEVGEYVAHLNHILSDPHYDAALIECLSMPHIKLSQRDIDNAIAKNDEKEAKRITDLIDDNIG